MPTPAGPERPDNEPTLPAGPLSLPESAEEDFRREMEEKNVSTETRKQVEQLQQSIQNPEAALQEALSEPQEKGIVETLKEEGESFAKKFNAAKGVDKITVVMDVIGDAMDYVHEMLLKIGGPALARIADMAERFSLLSPAWVDQLRSLAFSDRAVLQEMLKGNGLALVRDKAVDGKQKDKEAMLTLQARYKKEKAAREAIPAAPAAAPAVPGAPVAAPTAPVQTYTFEQYMNGVVSEALAAHDWSNKTIDDQGMKQVTLTEIVSVLPS